MNRERISLCKELNSLFIFWTFDMGCVWTQFSLYFLNLWYGMCLGLFASPIRWKRCQVINFFFFFWIDKFLSPLRLEPGTSHKPSPFLYHLSKASKSLILWTFSILGINGHWEACAFCNGVAFLPSLYVAYV